jgi:hypothetical protein
MAKAKAKAKAMKDKVLESRAAIKAQKDSILQYPRRVTPTMHRHAIVCIAVHCRSKSWGKCTQEAFRKYKSRHSNSASAKLFNSCATSTGKISDQDMKACLELWWKETGRSPQHTINNTPKPSSTFPCDRLCIMLPCVAAWYPQPPPLVRGLWASTS